MTQIAREALKDCRTALEMLEQETDLRRWRVLWAGSLALIRAVGSVLDKVDSKNDPILKKIQKNHFEKWKMGQGDDEIFASFINEERNNILKEYIFNVYPVDEVEIVVEKRLKSSDGNTSSIAHEAFLLKDNIFRPIVDAYREGEDARDVYSDAIDWWDKKLAEIETERALSQ